MTNPTTAENLPRQTPRGLLSYRGEIPRKTAENAPAPAGEQAAPAGGQSGATEAHRTHPPTRRTTAGTAGEHRRTGGAGLAGRTQPRRALHRGDPLLDFTLRLQPRDRVLTMLLEEHRALSTAQIAAVLYEAHATAERRLYRLRRAGWLDRFTAVRTGGRRDIHWVLGPLGAHWAAGEQHRPPPSARAGRDARRAIAASTHLDHHDGAHQVFIDLLVHARHDEHCRLARWWSPARTAAATGQRIHPDGHGVWEQHDPGTGHTLQVGFYLEYDTGTETLGVLRGKLEPYRRLRQDGPDYPLLLVLPSPTREANLHRKLNGEAPHLGITLATTSASTAGAHPDRLAGPVWKVAGNGRTRHRLIDLPSHHGKAGTPYHPGPPTPEQDPLYRLGDAPR
jgi:hypothetical protein